MSLSLGEKLRHAREEKGFALSEVADQTRISSLYLECIENDDYKILPGGIFNKGFVKSYAKFVGLNEQEALDDYARLIAATAGPEGEDLKVYRPEVLTDDRSSMAPTVIAAVVILALMTGGILFLIDYLRQPSEPPASNTASSTSNIDAETSDADSVVPVETVPDISASRIEFRALDQPVSLTATTDGKTSSNVVTPGTAALFQPKQSLKLSYSRSLAQLVQLTINEKPILLPGAPLNAKRNVIEFEINKDNLERIWNNAAIDAEVSQAALPANTDAVTEPAVLAATPSVQATSTLPRATPPPKPASTTRPAPAATAKPTAKPPVMKPTVIQVRPADGQ